MSGLRAERRSPDPVRTTANDRWKAQWSNRLAWATVAAVALHAAVLLLWPDWDTPDPLTDPAAELVQMDWITLQDMPPGGGGGLPVAAAPVSDTPDSLSTEPDLEEQGGASEGDRTALAEALRERLLRGRDAPRPSVTQPEAEPPASDETETGDGNDSTSIGGDASTAQVPEIPEADELELDRLSTIQPGLALSSSSAWVLLRNPVEVERYMRRNSRQQGLGDDTDASVSITLWIDERGSVEWAEVSESSGRQELDEIALALFNEVAAFRPALDEGVRVPKSVIFTVHFPW